MSERPSAFNISSEEYLKLEASSDVRHEYIDGQIFDMTGSTQAHNRICGNLFAKLHQRLGGTGCSAFITDVKVHVKAANCFYYPDVMVTCEPFTARSVLVESPTLIVEVLSPSTKQIDRREKLTAYRRLPSLKEYVIIHQNQMLLEMYRKGADGRWTGWQLRRPDILCLESLPGNPLNIPVETIYEGIELPSVVKEEEEEEEYEPSIW